MKCQTIIDSNINISLQFQVLTGALICIICDIEVNRCTLVFIASGQQISGLIILSQESFIVQNSFVQFRIRSINSSGLINVINESSLRVDINLCKLTGSNLIQSLNNGYIASTCSVNVQLNITQMYICIDKTLRFGENSVQIQNTNGESVMCDLCDNQYVVYGLCSGVPLDYSESVDGMFKCVYPFEYFDNQCICAYGYLLNKTKCINVIDALSNMKNLDSNDQYISKLQQMIENITNILVNVDQNIVSNITEIENRIISNYSKSDYNLFINSTILDNRIFKNISNIKNVITTSQLTADTNLLLNTSVLDWRIFNNISHIQLTINNLQSQLNDFNTSLQNSSQIIEHQQNIIKNLTQQLNCTNSYGYSLINGSCVQVTCSISGQQSINGICQCTNINSVVIDGSCICPLNSNLIGISCVCSISGQAIQNGSCICSTTGAFLSNNICTCGINSLNISNICSCPSGASLINGVCTCITSNAYISGNQCVCPAYSSIVGNTCSCPANSQIVNNICTCNLNTGLVMNNGVCQCQTSGAYINIGVCTCGVNAQNISNQCLCPTNSSLINNVCVCDQITGQQIINGICQCINNSCYGINIPNLECSQEVFTQTFNIYSVTNQIYTSNDFSAGYVFSTTTFIQNAFINVANNVYTTTFNPLFQSQNTFMNLKIQFGAQVTNTGSFMVLSSSSIIVNQMNIISKSGSQIMVNSASQLNILTSTSINSSITNLLINLSFAPSNGNITLVSNIDGLLNISGYEVLGSYISTLTVAMIGININSASVSVNQVSFRASCYNVGNSSSYFFGNSTSSTFTINNIAIILGTIENFLLLDSITSTASQYYLFGGIVAIITKNSVVNAYNVILDSYQKFSTNITNSGLLIGYVLINSSSIFIRNVCLQQNITSTTQSMEFFGLIGFDYCNISIINASIVFSVQSTAYIWGLGIIAIQKSKSAEIVNMRASTSVSSNSGSYVGSIFGSQEAFLCSIQNVSVFDGILTCKYTMGGIAGHSTNIKIQNTSVSNVSIIGASKIGGYFGESYQPVNVVNSKIEFVHLSGSSLVGLIVGKNVGVYSSSGSSSTQNYINGVLQSDCPVLSNTWSVVGCE
ncbi:Conserved_hypothetical protein [Hexamita inflata]|uniref:Uncharacterized protein n=1 Tax=Hexamita inflata TaxID=28002 RepID=A0AA86UFI1_9EUKA|nr:Conserved hypothetical protein [Hexamita inflata]